MKEELQLISDIYKRINISELAPRDVIKGHLRDARRMLNDLTVKLSQHDVSGECEHELKLIIYYKDGGQKCRCGKILVRSEHCH